jgi:hypothetical protein
MPVTRSTVLRPSCTWQSVAPTPLRPAATAWSLLQVSHGLAGRYGTMASIPDTLQDADLRFWIAEHWPDGLH